MLIAGNGGAERASERVAAQILIVEDNDLSRKLLNDLLEAHGHSILATASGVEALRLTRERKPNLILIDIQLADLSGIEVIRRLKADPSTSGIPVVVVTASLLPDIRRNAWDSGCDGFLEKPIDIDGFLHEVEHQLQRSRPSRTALQ